jgi:hypothetical protein
LALTEEVFIFSLDGYSIQTASVGWRGNRDRM